MMIINNSIGYRIPVVSATDTQTLDGAAEDIVAAGLAIAEIGRRSRQNLITLQPHRITAAPTAAAINGTIDPEADSLSSEATWKPMNDPAMPTSALVA
jgi:hypothetical protein